MDASSWAWAPAGSKPNNRAYGIPFPPLGERFDRLTEQLEILTGLWSTPVGSTFNYRGGYYDLDQSPALPKPVQSPYPPVIIGGTGLTRTPLLAARFADEYNLPFVSASDAAARYAAVVQACEKVQRDAAGRGPRAAGARRRRSPSCVDATDARGSPSR